MDSKRPYDQLLDNLTSEAITIFKGETPDEFEDNNLKYLSEISGIDIDVLREKISDQINEIILAILYEEDIKLLNEFKVFFNENKCDYSESDGSCSTTTLFSVISIFRVNKKITKFYDSGLLEAFLGYKNGLLNEKNT